MSSIITGVKLENEDIIVFFKNKESIQWFYIKPSDYIKELKRLSKKSNMCIYCDVSKTQIIKDNNIPHTFVYPTLNIKTKYLHKIGG